MKNIFWISICLFTACTAELIGPQALEGSNPDLVKGRKVLLVNEGNFGRANASISAYVPKHKQFYPKLVQGANKGVGLGDVAQDMLEYTGRYYISLNASGYIAVVDTADFQILDSIIGQGLAPRYMTLLNDRIYATDVFASKLWVIDPSNHQLIADISLPSNGKYVVPWQNTLAVSIGSDLVVINPASNRADTILQFGSPIDRMLVDKDDALWVLTTGSSNIPAQIHRLAPSQINLESYDLNEDNPAYLTMNLREDRMYYVAEDAIYTLEYSGGDVSSRVFFFLNDQNVYALDVDHKSGDLYLVDALDFDQHSDVYRIDQHGNLVDQFKAGIITGGFYFTP